MRRASCAASPSVPSNLSGKPITTPRASNCSRKFLISRRSFFQLLRRKADRGRTVRRNSSETATPTRRAPKSSASRRPSVVATASNLLSVSGKANSDAVLKGQTANFDCALSITQGFGAALKGAAFLRHTPRSCIIALSREARQRARLDKLNPAHEASCTCYALLDKARTETKLGVS